MSTRNKMALPILVCIFSMSVLAVGAPAQASDADAFIGGVLATKILGNMRERTEAEQRQAAAAEQTTQRPRSAPAASASRSPDARIAELGKLAVGGHITPEEYKPKKKAILDSI